ncbi:MAG: cytochrome C oxidase subunit IV family protein [Planctomycetaceae bacterium]|nr:cytochrome C oxidase subunit IV family protein [Planctomycetales bacterium]MCB9874741.1 cytochrome C oxidase subunit IV family protein [Planctomycetaceae bacterium]HRX82101.1 cytochrome C oxidase subunit IV family protein [Pirellulaceae bacterium]
MSHDKDAHDDHQDGGHDHGHGGLGKYLAVGAALAVLTIISFAAGSSQTIMSTPQLGWTIMIAVSCCKALLVMLVFMHLIWEANWKYVLTVPASIMSLFLMLMLVPDVGLRTRNYSEERLLRSAVPVAPETHSALEIDATHDKGAPHKAPPKH